MQITVFESLEQNRYFFSRKHSQKLSDPTYVPTTFTLPMEVTPRPGLLDGWVRNVEDLRLVFFQGGLEIPNPDPEFAVEWGNE